MARPQPKTVRGHGEVALAPGDRQPGAEREGEARRQFYARSRVGVGAERGDPVGRLGRRAEGGERQVADVKVALELDPGKTFAIVVYGDGLAVERLGFERSVGGWRTP